MTLDLTTSNLFSNPAGSGSATAQPGSSETGTSQGAASVEAGASPFALMVNANQAQGSAAQTGMASKTSGANATAPVREAALTSTSPLAMEATAPVVMPGAPSGETELGDDLVIPVTPVAPVAPAATKPARPVQNVLDTADPSTNSTTGSTVIGDTLTAATGTPAKPTLAEPTPAAGVNAAPVTPAASDTGPAQASTPQLTPQLATADGTAAPVSTPGNTKTVAADKPASEIILPKPGMAGQPQGQPVAAQQAPAANGQATIAEPAGVQPPVTQTSAPQAQGVSTLTAATTTTSPQAVTGDTVANPRSGAATATPAAASAVNLAAPKSGEPRLDTTKTAAGKANASPAASVTAAASKGAAPTPPAQTGQAPTPTTDGTAAEPLRQRGQAEAAIQTASSLAARPNGQGANASNGQAGNSAQASTGSPGGTMSAAGTQAAGTPASDPAAALAADRNAPVPAAQSGAPITPLTGAMGEGQAQAATMADSAQADAALQAETDFNLSRADGRLAADKSGSHLPRFTPHSATQLAGQITKQVSNGNRVFDIRLDPAELGKVDVRIELRADNRVHAVLTVERPETLNELQRSARDLERALADAGLELGEDGLSFQMNDGQNPADEDTRSQGEALPIFTQTTEMAQRAEDELASRPRSAYGFLLSGRSGVDMQV